MMTFRDDPLPRSYDPDHSQNLLMAAYTRLMQPPRRSDGIGSTRITTIANWELRLIELRLTGQAEKGSLWVELFDLTVARSIDSRGCHDLAEAAAAVESFIAFAQQRLTGKD